ncbi:hypothetical protein [Mesorhizobium sp. A623]
MNIRGVTRRFPTMKNALAMMKNLMDMIMKFIMSVLRALFGWAVPSGGGGYSVPAAPKVAGKPDEESEAAEPGLEMSPERKLTMCSDAAIAAILAYAGTPKDKRSAVDLTEVLAPQRTWLLGIAAGGDEKTLAALAKMEPDKARDAVLMAVVKARSGMTKHLTRDERLRIVREASSVGEELIADEKERRDGPRSAPAPRRRAMGF